LKNSVPMHVDNHQQGYVRRTSSTVPTSKQALDEEYI